MLNCNPSQSAANRPASQTNAPGNSAGPTNGRRLLLLNLKSAHLDRVATPRMSSARSPEPLIT